MISNVGHSSTSDNKFPVFPGTRAAAKSFARTTMDVFTSMLMFLVAVATVQAVVTDGLLNEEWEAFKIKYQKTYSDATEEKFRKMIFIEKWNAITKHNEKYKKDEVSYGRAINHFSDLLNHERRAATKCLKRRDSSERTNFTNFLEPENVGAPSSIDWVKKGFVTAVKNQGDCGSCWTFSATGALEGQHKRKTGKLVDLSEQNLVDCAGDYGNEGCEGGFPEEAFNYIRDNKGIDTEKTYPYEAKDGKCRFKKGGVGATDKGYTMIKPGDEKKLKAALGTVGPISVSIDASHDSFGDYSEGVYDEPDCSTEELDHAVLAVGYGTYNGKDFWLVKNSWGDDWGLKGYIRMARNKKNQCGIATEAYFPKV